MTPWFAKRVRSARRLIFEHPPLFRGLRFLWHVAIVPRESYRRVSHAWKTRHFREQRTVSIDFRDQEFSIVIDPANGLIDETIFAQRMWSPQISGALVRLLAPGDTFVDIGANIGFFSLLGSRIVEERGSVFAFEPIPEIAEQCRRSIAVNQMTNVTVVAKACGAEPGYAKIFTNQRNMGMSSLAKHDERDSGGQDIEVVKLDDALRNVGRVDLIKIDVEGFEHEVLVGARETLAKHAPKIIMELSPSLYERIEPGLTQRLLHLLEAHGYRMSFLDGTAIPEPKALAKELTMRGQQADVLCVRP